MLSIRDFRRMAEYKRSTIQELAKETGTYICLEPDHDSRLRLHEFAQSLGIENPVRIDTLHCTLTYSRKHVDVPPEFIERELPIPAVGDHLEIFTQQHGAGCLVFELHSPQIVHLHHLIRSKFGATHDYPDFRPHITLAYDYDGKVVDTTRVPVVFTSYKIEPIREDWDEKLEG